jgi:hypothetical protein
MTKRVDDDEKNRRHVTVTVCNCYILPPFEEKPHSAEAR